MFIIFKFSSICKVVRHIATLSFRHRLSKLIVRNDVSIEKAELLKEIAVKDINIFDVIE